MKTKEHLTSEGVKRIKDLVLIPKLFRLDTSQSLT